MFLRRTMILSHFAGFALHDRAATQYTSAVAVVIKKYSNRRLYDTDESRYITLDELTDKIRSGTDVSVVDAKSGEDLTQATLTQVILETSAAKLLPVPVLMRLIRMKDDALAEFFGQYVSVTLDMYLQAKQGAQAMRPYFPLASVPFSAGGNPSADVLQHQPLGRRARPTAAPAGA